MAVTDAPAGALARSLAIATGALLTQGAMSGPTDAAGFGFLDDDWETEARVLYYAEPGRVTALEPIVSVKRNLDVDRSVSLRLALDTLTGASGTGAVAWNEPQTFTRPSGNGQYTISAGEQPLDDTFHDTRIALSGGWTGPIAKQMDLSAGLSYSTEYDYLSIGTNALLSRRFDANNRTLSLGVAYARDTIEPVGGRPVAFQAMPVSSSTLLEDGTATSQADADGTAGIPRAVAFDQREQDADKDVLDLVLGITQVIDRKSLVQVNLGLGQVDGYQNDPYKFLSVIDDTGVVYADAERGLPLVAYENRPDSRSKQTLYAHYKRDFDGPVLDLGYRFGTDNWGIDSHTLEFAYRIPVGRTWWEPTLRYYTQGPADFFTPFLLQDELPAVGDDNAFATADYRLGGLDTWTIGMTYGRQGRIAWSATLEYYLQLTDDVDDGGRLAGIDLSPDIDAVMFRLGTTF